MCYEQLFLCRRPWEHHANLLRCQFKETPQGDADLYMSYNRAAHYYDFESVSQYGNGSNLSCDVWASGETTGYS